jgi:hypothetical protein
VQMAFDAIEELQTAPVDEPLRHLLGDDGRLLLSYAVHWCSDAVVRLDPMDGGYRYEGPDVVYGGRMWVFAAPNVVTVSPAALAAATRMPQVRGKLFDSVFLRGVTARQNLYVITDPTKHKLREAEALAAEQVRRARQAQREMAELKSSDVDRHQRHLTYSFNRSEYDSSDLDVDSFSGCPRINDSGSGNSDHSTPTPALRQRTSTAGKTTVKRDNVAGITVVTPTSIIVPASATDAPLFANVTGTSTAVGPTGVATNPLVSPLAVPTKPQEERRMVRRPSGYSSSVTSSANESAGSDDGDGKPAAESKSNDDNEEDDEGGFPHCPGNKAAETFVEGCAGVAGTHQASQQQQPKQTARLQASPHGIYAALLPALPPISSTQTSAATTAPTITAMTGVAGQANIDDSPLPCMSSRRALETLYTGGTCVVPPSTSTTTASPTLNGSVAASTSTTTIGSGTQRHGDAPTQKPLVVVPPSAELAGTTGLGAHGVSSKSSSGTPPSDGAALGHRTTIGAASSYDNPLAHDLAAAPSMKAAAAAAAAVAQGCTPLDGGGGLTNTSAPFVAVLSFASDGGLLADSGVSLDNFSSDLLLRPAITVQADHLLRTVFDRQAVALDVSYDSVRVLVYYFYSSYKILFRPLAAPERHNIYRRLVTAFGVPQQGILEHLAARCAIRFLQRHEETQTLMWDQQRRLQVHAHPTTASASVSDEGGRSSSNE